MTFINNLADQAIKLVHVSVKKPTNKAFKQAAFNFKALIRISVLWIDFLGFKFRISLSTLSSFTIPK